MRYFYNNEEAIKICMENYKKYKNDSTIYTTAVPFTFIAKKDLCAIFIRYAATFNQKPNWVYNVELLGVTVIKAGFNTYQDALEAAIIEVDKLIKKFEEDV